MIRYLICLLVFGFGFKTYAQFNPQSDKITNKFFPEVTADIQTPAFKKEKGFTKYDEMMLWLDQTLANDKQLAKIQLIGNSQNGKPIPLIILSENNNKPKTKVWLQGGLHGDEPAGTEAMLYLIHQLVNNPETKALLQDLEIAIVPMANIDGYEKQIRYATNGMDLNRDQTRLKAQESIFLKRAFHQFGPAIALDFHEYRPYRKDFGRMGAAGVTSAYDAMFLFSGNLNVPSVLRNFTSSTFVENAKQVLKTNQLSFHDYVTTERVGGQVHFNLGSVHSRSSATNFALQNTVSTLLEIRGVGIGRTSFKRRVKTSYLIAISYLETAIKEQNKLKQILAEAGSDKGKVVAISEKKVYKDSLDMIDLANNQLVKMQFTIHDALQSKPVLTRERPTAYLISSKEKQAIFCLKTLGLVVDSLTADQKIEVEAYQLVQSKLDVVDGEDEEAGAESSTSKTATIEKLFEKGTYIIALNQAKANLVIEVLEPENPNGFVALKVINATHGQELPIYRYMSSNPLK